MSQVARWAAFWSVILACVGFVGYVAVHGARPRPADTIAVTTPTPSPTKPPTVGLFIGDSYVAGSGTVTQSSTFAPLSCAKLGWICYYDAQSGAGYLSRGSGNEPGSYPDRLDDDKVYLPDVVVVSGGRADLGSGSVRSTATKYFRALKSQFASSKLVVLQPFWPGTDPPYPVQTLQEEVRLAAQAAGAKYVSTSGWLSNSMMTDGGGLPDAAGHRAIAAKLVKVLSKD